MPLRYVRSKLSLNADTALSAVVATTSITRDLSELTQFPPAKAAAGVLLVIFQTIQDIQQNRTECYRLARRCLSLLVDIKDQMDGRMEDAPEALLKNLKKFEATLHSIQEYMSNAAERKWHDRLLRKSSIEEAIADYNSQLDDAARSFQIATLIQIHYAVSNRSRTNLSSLSLSPPPAYSRTTDSLDSLEIVSSPTSLDSPELPTAASRTSILSQSSGTSSDGFVFVSEPEEMAVVIAKAIPAAISDEDRWLLDNRGYRRYSHSEVMMKRRLRGSVGWWSSTTHVHVEGRALVQKSYGEYGDQSMKKWMRDVRILQNLYHPNLPQMVGYSTDEAPTPFILLANVQTRLPQALVLDTIRNGSLASCTSLILRYYRDTLDATLYMQRQLNLSDSKTQDYVEHASYRIDAENTLVMGLPPPEIDNITSWRNFGLAHSIRDVYLNLLPSRGYARHPLDQLHTDEEDPGMQMKAAHLGMLMRSIFPGEADANIVHARLKALLHEQDDEEEEEDDWVGVSKVTLAQIRRAAIAANGHDFSWHKSNIVPHRFSIGDVGYLPSDSEGPFSDSFVVVGNVLKQNMVDIEVVPNTFGEQAAWDGGFRKKQTLQPFQLPYSVYGWPVVATPGTKQELRVVHESFMKSTGGAWKVLLDKGAMIAHKSGVKPEELILITRVGTDDDFMLHDFRAYTVPGAHMHNNFHGRNNAFGQNRPGFGSGFNQPGHFQHPHMHMNAPPGMVPSFGGMTMAPLVFYLFSSSHKDHVPYWSESPMYQPLAPGANPPPFSPQLAGKCTGTKGRSFGFIDYIQLHAEDFQT